MLTRLIATRREIERVIAQVAAAFGETPASLRGKSHTASIVLPRRLAMYIAKERTGASLSTLGEAFGGRHHTTVLDALTRVNHLRHRDPQIDDYLKRACSRIPAPASAAAPVVAREAVGETVQALIEHLAAATETAALLRQLIDELPGEGRQEAAA